MKNERFEVRVKAARAPLSVVKLVIVEAADVAGALVQASFRLQADGVDEWALVSVALVEAGVWTIESRDSAGGPWRRDTLGWVSRGTELEARRALVEARHCDSSRDYRMVRVDLD